jgi:hypothetical protein
MEDEMTDKTDNSLDVLLLTLQQHFGVRQHVFNSKTERCLYCETNASDQDAAGPCENAPQSAPVHPVAVFDWLLDTYDLDALLDQVAQACQRKASMACANEDQALADAWAKDGETIELFIPQLER